MGRGVCERPGLPRRRRQGRPQALRRQDCLGCPDEPLRRGAGRAALARALEDHVKAWRAARRRAGASRRGARELAVSCWGPAAGS